MFLQTEDDIRDSGGTGVQTCALPISLSLWQGEISGLLNPLQPRELLEGLQSVVLLKITCWINWVLFWVNILPAFPMDGGPALRAWLTPLFGYRTSVLVVARAAKLTAIGMCGIAWLTRDAFPESLVPAWVPLLLFADRKSV